MQWFEPWHSLLDDALQEVPEMETCPHELFRRLMLNPSHGTKRAALITDGGRPVAVAGLRRERWHWEPVGNGASPRSVMPVQDGYLWPALAALGVDVRISATQERPPTHLVRHLGSIPVYKMNCKADYEQYWRKSGNIKAIRPARSRTQQYKFIVDAPGSVAWVIERWADKWKQHPAGETSNARDKLLAAEFYFQNNQLHTYLLMDEDVPVAGNIFFVHRDELLWHTTYMAEEYKWQRVGTRCLELTFRWASEAGYHQVDLGGGHRYKEDWAPQDGEEWSFNVCPAHLDFLKSSAKRTVRVGREMTTRAGKSQKLAALSRRSAAILGKVSL
ncbi:MAG: GNAT family N-acetyltransferase [Dehalococcoidia bacterium]